MRRRWSCSMTSRCFRTSGAAIQHSARSARPPLSGAQRRRAWTLPSPVDAKNARPPGTWKTVENAVSHSAHTHYCFRERMIENGESTSVAKPSTESDQAHLQLSVLAYNLGNLWRRLILPPRITRWSLTSLQQRLVKTGGRLVKHARYYWLLLAPAGGRASDPAAVRRHAPEDLGTAGARRIAGDR